MQHEPFRPKTVLAAVAEGTHSDHAVAAAIELCNRFEAALELVHAVALPPLLLDSSQLAKVSAKRVGQVREELLAHLRRTQPAAKVGGKPVDQLLHVAVGQPAKVVLDHLEELKADLLVLGESGKSKNMDFGGVAQALLGKAPCPIWMQTSRPGPIEHVLAPVDLSEHSLAALAVAVDLAELYGAEVTALHCFAVQEYAFAATPYGGGYVDIPSIRDILDTRRRHFDEQMEVFDWRGVRHRTAFGEEDAVRGILRRQEEHDLIVMGTHGRTGLTAALLGGVAYRVMRTAHRPVLAIRQPDREWLM